MVPPDQRAEDRALVARVASGDRRALEDLYRRHAGWLAARLQVRCGDPDLTDLALQDTFVSVWRSAGRFTGDRDGGGDVAAWMWTIAIRRLIDVLRKRRAAPLPPEVVAAELHQRTPTVDETAALALGGSHGDLDAAMRSLPDELRAVLVATAIDGLTTKEAARLLGVPQGTVKTRLMRARHHLRTRLSEAIT